MNVAEKLRALADGMEKQIEGKINSGIGQQRPTARRARIAGSMYEEGMKLKQVQSTLRNLARLHEMKAVPKILQQVTSRAMVEEIMRRYGPPVPGAHRSFIRDVLEAVKGMADTKSDRARILRLMDKAEDGHVEIPERLIPVMERLIKKAEKKGSRDAKFIQTHIDEYRRFAKIGIKTRGQFEEAKAALMELAGDQGEISPREAEIRKAEYDLIGVKIPGFFVTPKELAERMVVLADVRAGMKVLEPSAGNGSIAMAIRDYAPEVELEVVERNFSLRKILELREFKLVGSDFLECKDKYDRIIMNPPFENFQDIDHVLHAYGCLKPGGIIVAIMCESTFFRKDRKAVTFRDWLDDQKSLNEQLPSGTFSKEITSTGVVSRLVVIEKAKRRARSAGKELAHVG